MTNRNVLIILSLGILKTLLTTFMKPAWTRLFWNNVTPPFITLLTCQPQMKISFLSSQVYDSLNLILTPQRFYTVRCPMHRHQQLEIEWHENHSDRNLECTFGCRTIRMYKSTGVALSLIVPLRLTLCVAFYER